MTTATSDFDVIVCGGGPSGFIAAIAAARSGARTLLVERYGFLGGMPTVSWLGPISPFYFRDERVIAGVPQEFVERMVAAGGSTGHIRCTNPHGSGSYLCFYDRETYKWTAMSMYLEAGGTPLLHTWIADALVEDGRVTGIVVANKSGRREIRAKVVVDATGDGDVAARAGAAHTVGNGAGRSQPATLMFDMTGVDTARVKQYMDDHLDDFEWASEFVPVSPYSDRLPQQHFVGQGFLDLVAKGLREDRLHLGRDSMLFLTTVQHGVLHFNSTRVADVDATDAESLTRGEIEGRRQVMSLSRYLIENVPGFERAALAGTGTALGIRESRHITGGYVLTGADVVGGARFDDVVSRGYFPIDIHNLTGKEGYEGGGTWRDLDDTYDVPMRSLIPRDLEGLVIAGRAISADHDAHGSFRTQGGVMAIGHAAGVLAATAAASSGQVRETDHRAVQERLLEQGASLRRDPEAVARDRKIAVDAVSEALAAGRISPAYLADAGTFTGRAPRL
ncbi:FAD-dependent oxidoreductase [Jiangella aurantiaca]|uniref:FAD-dependent oxidoreductase n=1 Tax=Jiangella aurantiaca TaxID=2530373 RepID=A0A4R5AGA9_9ACTN|nr:FAD-dependent oxidoreductase [Jiangella aurantiaca]TDD69052.1 FAD-dependent oxidoreductase [Jiangella aurantiaca]